MGETTKIGLYRGMVEEHLERYLPEAGQFQLDLIGAIRSSLTGGKRFRPVLTLASAEAVGGSPEAVLPAAIGMEFIHTCSLILDDLPSMDNDHVRRGRQAIHRAFGEATAILAAHALLTHAYALVVRNAEDLPVGKETVIAVVAEVSASLGVSGLIGGQYLDLHASGSAPSGPSLETIHSQKTAALFVAAALTGAAFSGASEGQISGLRSYAENLGRAFQSIDDLVDREVDRIGRGAADECQDEVGSLIQAAKESVAPLGARADTLRDLADIVIDRSR